jgi:hypothetical protein
MDIQDKIIQKIGGIDKAAHFFASAWICLLMPGWLYALIAAVVLAVGKELVDKYIRKTEFSVRDMVVTIVGGAVSAGIIVVRELLSNA